jgi:hypothetical protein
MPNVFMVDPLVCIGKPELYVKISNTLQSYFDAVGKAMRPADKITVSWDQGTPAPAPQDLLVYFTSPEFSVVERFAGTPANLGADGWTFYKTGADKRVTEVASEVYCRALDPDFLAKLAFHEIMHNKLAIGNELHKRNGLAQETVGPDTKLTPENSRDLGAAMRNAHPQWTGGIALLVTAKARRDAGSDLWYM